MIISRARNAIVRATAAFLLAMTFVTPALAEIGCANECIAQLEVGAPSVDPQQAFQDGQTDNDSERAPVDQCAFGPCNYASVAAAGPAIEKSPLTSLPYMTLAAYPLATSWTDAPERPPSA